MRNKKNYILVTTIALCVGCFSHAQTQTAFLSPLFTSQKAYVSSQIQDKQRSKFHSYINFGNALMPRIYDEIKKIDTSFWNTPSQTNLLEFFPFYGNLKGVLWKDNGTYYSFLLDEGKKLIVQQQSLGDLETKFRTIIQNFGNWGNTIFSVNGTALSSPTEHPFYLISKISSMSVSTLGFYY